MRSGKKIAILGATGSIGQNCLHVAEKLSGEFNVTALTTNKNISLLIDQVKRFRPHMAAVTGVIPTEQQQQSFKQLGTRLFFGQDSLVEIVREADYELLINSVVGAAGFVPTLTALEAGKNIALANKETLVVGGELIIQAARKHGRTILPIDSEHSAIFQCLIGEDHNTIEEIILTASGGPFRTWSKEQLFSVTVEQALNHPNWSMGNKITIDSATMMNKGLEVIEAKWLFHVPVNKIRVVIHPQSIIHSMVAFYDGSVKAQLGEPDMRVPIQLAMTYPQRKPSEFPRIDFGTLKSLTFEEPDPNKFRALALAYQAAETGGTAPAVMNAANETAVRLFLEEKISFIRIAECIEETLDKIKIVSHPGLEDLLQADKQARAHVMQFIGD
ncbi:1-deoxy-D-xylulose-5-phosphate reductoisomerase [candidate division KSB1 bacterium]|nr:1-deoxy-D-xylulose-5-phosphate reductoisomerase [candidate division KSB1 bacterium]